jgi:hypothetical protein
LNELVNDRSGTYSGGSTTTTTSSSNNDKPAPQSQAKVVGAGNTFDDGTVSLGSVSKTGQYAGDGFEFVQNENTNALTRRYTGANEGAGLGQDVIAGGTSDKNTKEVIANISLNEGSEFASSAASATDGDLLNLLNPDIEGTGRSDSYADQVGKIDYTPKITYDSTKTGAENRTSAPAPAPAPVPVVEPPTFGEVFAASRAAGADTFTYNGALFNTDLAPRTAPATSLRPQSRPEVNYNAFGDSFADPATVSDEITEAQSAAAQDAIAAETNRIFDPRGDQIQSPTSNGAGIASLGEDDLMAQEVVGVAGQDYADSLPDFSYDFTAAEAPTSAGDYLVAAQKRRDAGLDSGVSPTSLEATTPTVQVAGPVTELPSSADFAMPGTQQAAYATSMGPGGRDPFDPRTIMPTSEQMAIFDGTAQESVDRTPAGSISQFIEDTPVLDNIIGAGEDDTFGEQLGLAFAAGTSDLLPGLAAQGAEQQLSAALEAGRDLNIPGFGQQYVTDPMFKYRQAGLGSLSGLDQMAQEQELFRTGVKEEVGPASLRLANAPTAAETYLQNYADRQFAELAESIAAMPEEARANLEKSAVTIPDKFGYGENQVDPAFALAMGEDPTSLAYGQTSIDPRATAMQAMLTAPTALSTVAASFVDPRAGFILGSTLAGGEGQRASNAELDAALSSGELQNTDAYKSYATAVNAAPQYSNMSQADKDAVIINQMRNDVSKGLVPLNLLSGAISAATPGMLKSGVPGRVTAPVVEGVEEGLLEQVVTNTALDRQAGLQRNLDPEQVASEGLVGAISSAPISVASQVLNPSQFPTAGQPAQSTVQTSYDGAQLGDGTDPMATSMEAMAAQQIIEDQVSQFGAVDRSILNRLQQSTGLSMEELGAMEAEATSTRLTPDQIAAIESAPVGDIMTTAPVSPNLADEVTGIGGGSNISVRPNPDGTITLTNPSGLQTVVESGQSLDEAIQVFDEITTPIDAQTEALKLQAQEEAAALSGARDVTSTPFTSVRREGISSLPAAPEVDQAPASQAKGPDAIIADQRAAQPETPVVKARDVLSQYNKDIDAMPASSTRTKRMADAQVINQIIEDSTSYNPISKGDTVNLANIARRLGAGSFMDSNASSPTKRGVEYRPKVADIQKSLQDAGILGPVDSNGNQELLADVARDEGLSSNNTAAIDKKIDADNAAPAVAEQRAAATSLSTIPTRVVVGDSLEGYSAADVSGQPVGSSTPQADLDVRGTTGGPFTNMKNEPIGSIDNAPYGEPVRRVIDNPDGTTTIQVGSRLSSEGAAGNRDNYVSAAVTLPSSATNEQKEAAYKEAVGNWKSNYEGATTSGDIERNAGKVVPNEDVTTFKAEEVITKKMDADNAAPAVEEDVAAVVEVGGVDSLEEFRERARSDLEKSKTINNTILSTIESLKSNGLTEEAAAYEAEANAIAERNLKARMASSTGTVATEELDANADKSSVTETETGATVELPADQTVAEQVPVDQDVFAADQVEQEAAATAAEQAAADAAAATETQTASTVAVSQVTDDGDEDEEVEVEVEVEDKVQEPGGDVTVDLDEDDTFVPVITSTDENGETITECPEGYVMVEGPDGPMCQKSVTTTRQRAGASTRAYTGLAGNIGRVGPGQRRKTTTSTERVQPTVRSA